MFFTSHLDGFNVCSFPGVSTITSVTVKHMARDKSSEITTLKYSSDPTAKDRLPSIADLNKEASRTNVSWPRKSKPPCNLLILPSEEAVCYCLAVPLGPDK